MVDTGRPIVRGRAGVALVSLVLGLVLFVPVAALSDADFAAGAIVVGVVAVLIFLVPLLVAGGALGAFGSSYWTLAYLRLTSSSEGAAPQPDQGA